LFFKPQNLEGLQISWQDSTNYGYSLQEFEVYGSY